MLIRMKYLFWFQYCFGKQCNFPSDKTLNVRLRCEAFFSSLLLSKKKHKTFVHRFEKFLHFISLFFFFSFPQLVFVLKLISFCRATCFLIETDTRTFIVEERRHVILPYLYLPDELTHAGTISFTSEKFLLHII